MKDRDWKSRALLAEKKVTDLEEVLKCAIDCLRLILMLRFENEKS